MFEHTVNDLPDIHRSEFDAPVGTDDEVVAGLLHLEQELSQLQLRHASWLADVERRGLCDRLKGSKTVAYVAGVTRSDPGRVQRDLRVGQTRRVFPELWAAAVDGRLSFDHLRAVERAANPRIVAGLVALQGELIALAGHGLRRWTHELRGIVELLDQDGGHDPKDDEARNRLGLTKTFDGLLHLAGTLYGEDADAAQQALNDRADELFLARTRDAETTPDLPVPDRATLLALAFIDLCLAGRAVDRTSSKPPRVEVTLVVNADEPTEVFDPHGVKVQDGSTRRVHCDADWYPLVINSLGVPLDMGRVVRLATDAQRRAIALRDGGCVFPHCDAETSWCETHHVVLWRDGGPTSVDLLASVCRHHHGVTHRRGWTMHTTPDGWFWWETPTGDTFWSQRHGQQRAGPTPTDGR